MRLYDRRGRMRERGLVLTSLKAADPAAGDRLLVRFTYPNDIRGTGLLVWERVGEDDERFLYLPALGRVRRIAGNESQESFVGTDFTYEDIGGREFDDYAYRLVEEGARWTDASGRAHAAYRLESTARDASAVYPRAVSLVRKDAFVVVQADVFNRRAERHKTYEVRRMERVDGYWTVIEAVMTDLVEGTRTELSTTTAAYNVGLGPDDFSRRELERGGR
jgi:hypothetical protein